MKVVMVYGVVVVPAVDGGVVFGANGEATVVWMRLEVAWCSIDRGGGSPEGRDICKVRRLISGEANECRYSTYLGSMRMYHDSTHPTNILSSLSSISGAAPAISDQIPTDPPRHNHHRLHLHTIVIIIPTPPSCRTPSPSHLNTLATTAAAIITTLPPSPHHLISIAAIPSHHLHRSHHLYPHQPPPYHVTIIITHHPPMHQHHVTTILTTAAYHHHLRLSLF
nr:hypothetical protein [Tanacetum cinerariifolium]